MSHLPPPLEASPACPAVTWEWPSQGQRSRAAGLGGFSGWGGLGSCVAGGAGASRAGAPTAEAGCGLGLSGARCQGRGWGGRAETRRLKPRGVPHLRVAPSSCSFVPVSSLSLRNPREARAWLSLLASSPGTPENPGQGLFLRRSSGSVGSRGQGREVLEGVELCGQEPAAQGRGWQPPWEGAVDGDGRVPHPAGGGTEAPEVMSSPRPRGGPRGP